MAGSDSDDPRYLADAKKTFQGAPKPVPTAELESVDRRRVERNRRDTEALDNRERRATAAGRAASPTERESYPVIENLSADILNAPPTAGTLEFVQQPWRDTGEYEPARDEERSKPTPWRESDACRAPQRERKDARPTSPSHPPPPLPEYDERQYADTVESTDATSPEQKSELQALLEAYIKGDKLPGR